MDPLYEALCKRKKEVSMQIEMLERSLENAPEGALDILCHKGTHQVQYRRRVSDKIEYISRDKKELVYALAQRKYNEDLLKLLLRQLKEIDKLLKNAGCWNADVADARRADLWQGLYRPLYTSSKHSLEAWLNQKNPTAVNAHFVSNDFISDQGFLLRSKSELIIANELFKFQVPVRYEYPLEMKVINRHGTTSTVTFFPDFTVLNPRTGQQFYWEHFGMIDDVQYQKSFEKISVYERNGITTDDVLILTYESTTYPLRTERVKEIIQTKLI